MKGRILALVVSVMVLLSSPVEVLARDNNISRGWFTELSPKSPAGYAFSLLGVPYRWGGQSLRGFDCSGFTRYVFKQVYDITLPRTSARQAGAGRAVQRNNLLPGDIVYFKTSRARVSHVGIFIGEDLFIHSTKSGGVGISSLNEPYYKKRYRGARRIGN